METAAPPPSYSAVTGYQQTEASNLTYVDFHPAMLASGGLFTMPTYERFDVLMARANEWLRSNPQFVVKNCESFETKLSNWGGSPVNTDAPMYFESGKHAVLYIRVLRIWVTTRQVSSDTYPHQIGYLNVVPSCLDAGGFLSSPKFASFGDTLGQINDMFRQQPLAGRVLNVETQDFKFSSWSGKVDPDESSWLESGKHATYFLNIIRLFYETGPPANEQLGCADFLPDCLSPSGFMKVGQYEQFGQVMQKASVWIQQQPGIRVVSVQSVDYKISHTWGGERINSQASIYYQSGKYTTCYMRILRVCYATPMDGSFQPQPSPFTLTYRTFTPCQLTTGGMLSMPSFETLGQTMQRAQAWANLTGARIVNCETVPVRMRGNQYGNAEVTFSYNRGNVGEYILFVLRVYLDGVYHDPPPSSLPPVPQIAQSSDSDCCTII